MGGCTYVGIRSHTALFTRRTIFSFHVLLPSSQEYEDQLVPFLEEEVVLKWHAQPPGKKDVAGKRVREAAVPFVKWLQTADVENQPEVS